MENIIFEEICVHFNQSNLYILVQQITSIYQVTHTPP